MTRGDGRTFRYGAGATAVVRYDDSGIDPRSGGYELVLTTCWPFDALTQGPLRYVLHATLLEEQADLNVRQNEEPLPAR